ncbi:MAG: hypothetical protein R3B90_06515 [Planctomycetaceae bacterium]
MRDRFYWVKEGAKFLERGVDRNSKVPELYHYMGEFLGRKVGYSDEKDLFRNYFMHDPSEAFGHRRAGQRRHARGRLAR